MLFCALRPLASGNLTPARGLRKGKKKEYFLSGKGPSLARQETWNPLTLHEPERKEKEELEKYKSYTDEDIKKEIYIIEHDLTSKGSRFVNILDFQKKVARAKGLLDTEENLQKEGIVYNAVDYTTAWEIIKKANTMGVSYAAFPDCQENRDGGIMIAASEEDKDIFKVARESVEFNYNSYNWHTDENIGTFPGFILNSVHSSDGCYSYTKRIINGDSQIILSNEEKVAVERAINGTAFDNE